jgi:hypothetical protein
MKRTVDNALTVRQLIELLEDEDQDLPVVFQYNYGDHWNTLVLAQVEEVEEANAERSSYHDMFKLCDDNLMEELSEENDEENENRVLVLR